MNLYYSQHTDYTSAAHTADVDDPSSDFYLIEADNADEALEKTAELDGSEYGAADIDEETTLVPILPILKKLVELGWTITPPELKA